MTCWSGGAVTKANVHSQTSRAQCMYGLRGRYWGASVLEVHFWEHSKTSAQAPYDLWKLCVFELRSCSNSNHLLLREILPFLCGITLSPLQVYLIKEQNSLFWWTLGCLHSSRCSWSEYQSPEPPIGQRTPSSYSHLIQHLMNMVGGCQKQERR